MHVIVTPSISPPWDTPPIAENPVSKRETATGKHSPWILDERVYSLSEAINVLIESGFTVGCDGELLPPYCMVSQLRGMSA
jgi:hypothetical protein